MKVCLYIVITLFLLSCASPHHKNERTNLDEVYIQSGIAQYFLPNIPNWASISDFGACRRNQNVRFFDFNKLNLSYKLKYEDLVQLQLSYNFYFHEQTKNLKNNDLYRPRDEENLFQNVLERVKGGDKIFMAPDFRDINLVWIDPALTNNEIKKRLINLFQSTMLDNGFPILVTSCLSQQETIDYLQKNKLGESTKIITQEMFSYFNVNTELGLKLKIELQPLFKSGQQLNIYVPKEFSNQEIFGSYKYKKY